jgi:hypothetical protein
MTPALFEPIIPASELPQTHALDRAAGRWDRLIIQLIFIKVPSQQLDNQLQKRHVSK